MAVIVGSARIDENGNARGGKAGDQTGRELSTQAWYDRWTNPWVLLRPKLAAHAEKIAVCMERACANQKIGYDQGQRDTLSNALEPIGYDTSKVYKKVETDCAKLVYDCCRYAGIFPKIPKGQRFYTGNEATLLMATGYFEKLTATKYIHNSAYLRRGDILVTKRQGHTVVVLSDGPKAGKVYAYGARILSKGTDGPDVTAMQKYLLALEYSLGKWGADGDFGSTTLAAVNKFQTDAKLVVDGSMDAADLAKLKEIAEQGWPVVQPPAPADPATTVYPVRGIIPDVSSNQGAIQNFNAFCNGTDFAIFRVIRSNGEVDSQSKRNMSECKQRGYPFGVYVFFKAITEATARAQVRNLFEASAPYAPRFYVLDVEAWYPMAAVRAAIDEARTLGVTKLGIYMGSYRWKTRYKVLAGLFDFVWLANYGRNTGYVDNIPDSPCDLHQYTSVATVPGISDKTCDRSRLTGNKPLSYFTGRQHSGVEYPGLVRATGTANVRTMPYKYGAKIGVTEKGRPYERRGVDQAGYAPIWYKGKQGWVSTKYIQGVSEK